jgi:putative FmdB family regulatory protein
MPTYEYRCERCGKNFDYFQSMNDPRLETCIFEGCGGSVKRLLGRGAGIIFKGSGFYETDYRSDAYKSAQKAETGAGADKGGGGEGSGAGKDGGGGSKEVAAPAPAAPAKAETPVSSS